jgi:uncharacterized protein conserved in bacteria (DUF2213)
VAIAYYGSRISPNQIETAEGYLICRSVPIARTGDQEYTAREVMQDGDPGQTVIVHRRPEDVFAEETIASFEGKPVTDDHPPENVQAENFASYARGHVQNVRQAGDNLVGDVYITDAKLASDVKHRVKREISCGYQCDLVPDGAGGYYQTNIRGNHVAVVLRGRAGHDVAIHDAANTAAEGRTNTMSKFTKGVLAAFGSAAKEASPEELEAMTTITASALDAAPAEEAPEADPAEKKAEPSPAKDEPMKDEVVYKEQKGVDLGTKIDRILELLEGMMKGREEKHMSDETDLDEIIEKLTGKPEDPDEAKMIGAEDAKCGAMPAATKDAAVELLRRVRPAVAAIEDKAARARVTDALLGAVKGDNAMTAIAQAAYDSAAAAAKSTSRSTFDQICAESEAAYAAMNPHKTK